MERTRTGEGERQGHAHGAVLEGKMGWHGHDMGQGGAGRDERAHLTAGSCLHELSAQGVLEGITPSKNTHVWVVVHMNGQRSAQAGHASGCWR